ncbi:MAG: CBS domain-containing protein [Methanocellales archaeon]|nr:CBS domain-containing protein [Methanocellales archaeon]
MLVSEIMHKPTFVDPRATVTDAARIMCEKNIASVIVGSATNPMGIFTERDVIRKVIVKNLDPRITLIKNVMHPEVITINEGAPIQEASRLLRAYYIRHLPVSDDSGKIIGMLSARTVMDGLKYAYVSRLFRRSIRRPLF